MTAGGACPGDGGGEATAGWRSRLLHLLATDDVDGALAAGLMRFPARDRGPDPDAGAGGHRDLAPPCPIATAQARLREAWAARERYRARTARLARREALRARRRRAQALPASPAPASGAVAAPDQGEPSGAPGQSASPAPAAAATLPPAAAAALARALARAAGRP